MKKYLSLFQNIKFNIWLFSALALASVLGTLIPQLPENPEKVHEFMDQSPRWGTFFQKIDFFNIYYSWWFVGLLGLLAFDVVACKLIFGKFPGFHTFKKKELDPAMAPSSKFKNEWTASAPPQEMAGRFKQLLKERGYTVQTAGPSPENKVSLLAAKHRVQRFGSWVSHVSILLILLANFTGALYGFRETLNIAEGHSARMQNREWVVSCDKFTVEWYPETVTPKTFASDLRLFERGQLAASRKILVNEPLEHKKVRFYQATYGPTLKEARVGFFIRDNPKKSPAVTLQLDEDVPVPGTPYSLRVLQFVPDFSLNEKKEASSRSPQPNNPALQVLVSKNGKPVKAPWIFENFPALQMPPIQKEDEFILVLAEYVPSYFTGLQVTYDPGADLFWTGCCILVLGLMALFYFHHRKIVVSIAGDGDGSKISLAGFSSRAASFEPEFLRLVDDCKAMSM